MASDQWAPAVVRVPTEAEEQERALHRKTPPGPLAGSPFEVDVADPADAKVL